jgi:hypothetical protein
MTTDPDIVEMARRYFNHSDGKSMLITRLADEVERLREGIDVRYKDQRLKCRFDKIPLYVGTMMQDIDELRTALKAYAGEVT